MYAVLRRFSSALLFVCLALFMTSCSTNKAILSQLDERDANLIVVFLESKGIVATKQQAASSGGVGTGDNSPKFDILVNENQAIDAMAILNQNGLPKRQGTNLLTLFAKQGLMSSDKEETIRYQAGLAQQITNTILMIDGVIDASVNLSFPPETNALPGTTIEKVTAAVYVKHQGVVDEPNLHLENKIKRLVSGSVNGLDVADVTVVSDRSRYTDVSVPGMASAGYPEMDKEYVSTWSIVMSKGSLARFRVLFFSLLIFGLLFAITLAWLVWKFYPFLRQPGAWKKFFSAAPFTQEAPSAASNESEQAP